MTTLRQQRQVRKKMIRVRDFVIARILRRVGFVLPASSALLFVAMFLLPLISSDHYSITRNTVSQLGAQNTPFSWILNSIYVLLAIGSLKAGWKFYRGIVSQRILIMTFSATFILSAFFNGVPADPAIRYNTPEAGLHTYFECTAILSFIILSISSGFFPDRKPGGLTGVAAGISIILLSILISESERFAGIWHRIILMIVFGWQLYTFRRSGEIR